MGPGWAKPVSEEPATKDKASTAIAVNLLWLVPGVVGGSEEYLCRQLAGLAEQGPDDLAVTLFVTEPFPRCHPDLVDAFPTEVSSRTGAGKAGRVAAENSWLAWRTRGFDLVHHGGGVVPPVRTAPAVLTVHDLQPLVHPELFHPVKRAYLRALLPYSARVARVVCTPSDHIRRSVIDRLGVPRNRVRVVPHGIEPLAARDPDVVDSAVEAVRRRHGITGPYFLYPAITYPHKNHLVLVRAFAAIAARHPETALVLTHRPDAAEGAVAAEIARLGVGQRVHRLGFLPRPELDALIDGARALVFPSRFEGFGAPVLEAMARGCPVVAAAATALPEVVGPAGLLAAADDPAQWAQAMSRLVDDDGLVGRLAAAGRERAREFTWRRSAQSLAEAYRVALGPANTAPWGAAGPPAGEREGRTE